MASAEPERAAAREGEVDGRCWPGFVTLEVPVGGWCRVHFRGSCRLGRPRRRDVTRTLHERRDWCLG
jgi:hypothetical protein